MNQSDNKSLVPFSSRTQWNLEESEWARTLRQRRAEGAPVLDLTASNPTRCGFAYDAAQIFAPLSASHALDYDPDPRGLSSAREAVCAYYGDQKAPVESGQIFLTTSTSEAYSFLFRLLCDPGDEVLIAQPSYPLFDFLAMLDDVRLAPYRLFYDYGWHLDPEALRQRVTPRTRAIVVVHPNNPTGHFTGAAERAVLEQICVAHGLALIVDEVFLDYPVEGGGVSFAAGQHPALTFVLSGLSKVAGLPQMKAAWIACFGPAGERAAAESRLEVIADTFLSMNALVQHAMPTWLAGRPSLQRQIRDRVAGNLASLDRRLQSVAEATGVSRLRVDGGWCVVLRIPALGPAEDTAVRLLRDCGVAVHPGVFFGLPDAGWLVVSLLPRKQEFEQGIAALLAWNGA